MKFEFEVIKVFKVVNVFKVDRRCRVPLLIVGCANPLSGPIFPNLSDLSGILAVMNLNKTIEKLS